MEAGRDFIPFEDVGQGTDRCPGRAAGCGACSGAAPAAGPGADSGGGPARASGLDRALAALREVSATAAEDAGLWGFRAAADFAGRVEELSRTVEYLQVVAAGAVDRTRKQSLAAAAKTGTSWTTGWRDDAPGSAGSAAMSTASAAAGVAGVAGDDTPGPGEGASFGTAAGVPGTGAEPWTADDASASGAVDDGYRNTVEFLRARLLISAAEGRRRLSLAERLLPRRGLAGQPVPAVHEELGAAVAAGEVASRAATSITLALEKVKHACDAGAWTRMEHALTRTAAGNDADFLLRVARRWTDALDQDGSEPSEELLRQLQGAFIRRRSHGLHHLEIFATTEQFEHLLTVMNTGTNPRTGIPATPAATAATAAEAPAAAKASAPDAASGEDPAAGTATGWGSVADESSAIGWGSGSGAESASGTATGWDSASGTASGWASASGDETAIGWGSGSGTASNDAAFGGATAGVSACAARPAVSTIAGVPAGPASENHPLSEDHAVPADDPGAGGLDLRSRPQQLLDGLVGGCKLALATGQLPASGGLRPQVMVTIDYRDLLSRLGTHPAGANVGAGPADTAGTTVQHAGTPQRAGSLQHPGPLQETGSLLFTGPVTASTVRKIACDADIIPVLLGSEGRILDIGRAARVFPPHLRKALIARDQGCAFPGCTIPAPWCEAHHITYWSRGGTSSTENGTLLCSHHHHLIHKEAWTIQVRTGIPWFIPPPHIDPHQRPRRNHYFKPAHLTTAA